MRVDAKESDTYDMIGTVLFSPKGKRVAYAATVNGKWYVVVDGAKSVSFDGVAGLAFSPDGQRFGHVAWPQSSWCKSSRVSCLCRTRSDVTSWNG